ncbi:MAG TPA: ABC transporter ATP-binding protein [Caulobacteraceae bacterium]|nr:ABC transporter ATP-binding protein [Caulobacteraceae bacterium]
MSFAAVDDPTETAPLPPAPPKQRAFRQAWRIAMTRPGLFTLGMSLYGAFYALPLIPGLIQRQVFDTLLGRHPAGLDLWSLIGLWFASQVFPLVAFYFAVWTFQGFTTLSRVMVRTDLLGWLMFAAGPRKPRGTAGEVLSRFRDDVNETLSFMEGWADTFGQALFAVLALAIMWKIDQTVTFAVIAPMLLVVVITQRITAGIHRYSRVAREAEARVTSFVGEMFAAVQAIRVAGAEPNVLARLEALNDVRRKTAVRYRVYVTLLDTFGVGTSSAALGLVLLLAASAMRDGRFTIGDFTLFASYVGAATSAPRWLGRLLARKRTADVAWMRITTLMDDAPDEALVAKAPAQPRPAPAEPAFTRPLEQLEVRGLTAIHPSSGQGVRDVSFTLRRGEVLIVTGRVGAGKSTLLKAVVGLLQTEGGQILWNGAMVEDPATFMTPPRSAYTAQAPRLFTESLAENILMGDGAGQDGQLLHRAVHLAVLEDDVRQLGSGLDTLVGTRGVTLSGGQVQRSAAARMFARTPELLVFDDASSALDVRTEHTFWERLFASGQHSCLAVSHRLEAYRHATEILVLDDGRVAARGTLRELLQSSPLFREVWHEGVHASAAAHQHADLAG